MSTANTAENIRNRFKKSRLKSETVTIDPGDGEGPVEVEIRQLPGGEIADITDDAVVESGGDGDSQKIRLRLALWQPALISRASFVPGTDEQVWPDVADVRALPPEAFNTLAEVAGRINQRNKAEQHAGKSPSGSARSDAPSSISLTN